MESITLSISREDFLNIVNCGLEISKKRWSRFNSELHKEKAYKAGVKTDSVVDLSDDITENEVVLPDIDSIKTTNISTNILDISTTDCVKNVVESVNNCQSMSNIEEISDKTIVETLETGVKMGYNIDEDILGNSDPVPVLSNSYDISDGSESSSEGSVPTFTEGVSSSDYYDEDEDSEELDIVASSSDYYDEDEDDSEESKTGVSSVAYFDNEDEDEDEDTQASLPVVSSVSYSDDNDDEDEEDSSVILEASVSSYYDEDEDSDDIVEISSPVFTDSNVNEGYVDDDDEDEDKDFISPAPISEVSASHSAKEPSTSIKIEKEGNTYNTSVHASQNGTQNISDNREIPLDEVKSSEQSSILGTGVNRFGHVVSFTADMTLVEFLRANKKIRDEDEILCYFSKSDIKQAVKQGKILIKKGRVIL